LFRSGDDLEPLEGARLLLPLAGADDLAELLRLGLEVEVLEPLLDGLRAHGTAEVAAEPVAHLPVELLVALQVLDLEVLEPGPDLLEAVELALRPLPDLPDLPVGGLADLTAVRGGLALGLGLGEVGLELLLAGLDLGVPALLDVLPLDRDLRLQRGQVALPGLGVDPRDHVGREVDDLLQVLRGQVEQVAEAGGDALEVPDVGHRSGELDVAHALTADLGAGHLDAAALTDDPLEADPLVLTAVALPVPGRAEDLLAEEAILLGLESPVVDRLRLLDLTVRPLPDVVSGRQADPQLVEEVDVQHFTVPLALSSHLFDTARLAPGQVDAEFLGGAEDVLLRLAHLDRHAVAREDLDIQAE